MKNSEIQAKPGIIAPIGALRKGEKFRTTWVVTNNTYEGLESIDLSIGQSGGIRVAEDSVSVDGIAVTTRKNDVDVSFQTGPIEAGASCVIRSHQTVTVDPFDTCERSIWLSTGDSNEVIDESVVDITIDGRSHVTHTASSTYVIKAESSRFGLKLEIENDGNAEEHNLECHVPLPKGIVLVRETASAAYDKVESEEKVVLSFPSLLTGHILTIGMELEVTSEAVPGDVILDGICFLSQSTGLVIAEPIAIHMPTTSSLDTSRIDMTGDGVLEAGQDVTITITAKNTARNDAHDVKVEFLVPKEIIISPGTVSIDNVTDSRHDPKESVRVPFLASGTEVQVSVRGTVRSPIANGTVIVVGGFVDDHEVKSHESKILSAPQFSEKTTTILTARPSKVRAGGTAEVRCYVHNSGRDVANTTKLIFDIGQATALETKVRRDGDWVRERHVNSVKDNKNMVVTAIGNLLASETVAVNLIVTMPDIFSSEETVVVSASLEYGSDGQHDIGSTVIGQMSSPKIGDLSTVTAKRNEPLTRGQMRVLNVRIENSGDAELTGARVDLDLHPSIRIQNAQGAFVGNDDVLEFQPVQPGAVAQANVVIHAVEDMPEMVVMRPRLHGNQVASKILPEIAIEYTRDVSAAIVSATKIAMPNGNVLARAVIQNTGQSTIDVVTVKIDVDLKTVKETTRLNGVIVADTQERSILTSGIHLTKIASNESHSVEVQILEDIDERIEFTINVDGEWTTSVDARTELLAVGSTALQEKEKEHIGAEDQNATHTLENGSGTESEKPEEDASESEISWNKTDSENETIVDHVSETQEETSFQTQESSEGHEPNQDNIVEGILSSSESTTTWPSVPNTEILSEHHDDKDVLEEAVSEVSSDTDRDQNQNENMWPSHVSGRVSEGSGPLGTLVYDAMRMKKIKGAMSRLPTTLPIGWYRHVLTMSLIVPSKMHVDPSNKNVEDQWSKIQSECANLSRGPMLKLTMGGFKADEAWSATVLPQSLIDATGFIWEAVLNCRNVPEPASLLPNEARSHFGTGFREIFDRDIDKNDGIGSGHALIILAESIPTDVPSSEGLTSALQDYKEALLRDFTPLVYQGSVSRQKKLLNGGSNTMDAAFENLLAMLGEIS